MDFPTSESSPPSQTHHHHHNMESSPSSRPFSLSVTGKTCAICLSSISGHRAAVLTTCSHAYCLRCLLQWSNYKRTCPLCNAHFDSYFSTVSLSSSAVRKHRLLPLRRLPPPDLPPRVRFRPAPVRRVLGRTREEINEAFRRSRPVPHRRSFGRLGSEPAGVIQDRVFQWRVSIYKCGLRAVPFQERNFSTQNIMTKSRREEILRRIEPWIQRELQAVLQDPDPSVIVHVATSLYLSSVEKENNVSSDSENIDLAPLRPFLGEWTNTFWHELRCFAECCFTLDAYDTLVEYVKSSEDC